MLPRIQYLLPIDGRTEKATAVLRARIMAYIVHDNDT